jgi:hypothetical protein
MASRNFQEINSLTKRAVILAGQFQAKGSGAPVIVSGQNGYTVTRTGTGLFTIQFADNYNAIGFAGLEICQATPTNTVSVVLTTNTSATPGASINLLIGTFSTPATAVDITQTSGDCIQFLAFLRNSSIPS